MVFSIKITIPFEDKKILSLKKENPHLSLSQCEVIHTLRRFFFDSFRLNRFLIHASAVVTNGECFLLSGLGGEGKSTQAELWVNTISNSFVYCDDRPIIDFSPTGTFVYSSPWSKYSYSSNSSYPLKGIAIIHKSSTSQIEVIPRNMAASKLLSQYNFQGSEFIALNSVLQRYIEYNDISVWNAECCLSQQSSIMMYNIMK